MANSPQAKKRARQSEVRRQRNNSMRSMYRTYIKKVLKAITGGKKEEATAAFQTAMPVLHSMTNKGIIHKNKASRHLSRLSAKIKAMAS